MAAEGSAYATLGVAPGADWDAVESAYKRLIKQHHPDRAGGDARRAAEINRAYGELRDLRGIKDALLLESDTITPVRRWKVLAIFSLGGFIALSFAAASMTRLASGTGVAEGLAAPPLAAVGSGGATFLDGPLDSEAVSAGVRQAQELSASGDELALTQASRACHAELRRSPGLALLDRCAAFDDAVVLLQDRDPLRDRGPFSELAVTGRQMSSATLLSGDYLEIDSRLDRIRLKVELALAPSELPAATSGEDAGAGF